MRTPHTERRLHFSRQPDHFDLAAERDLVRRANGSPG